MGFFVNFIFFGAFILLTAVLVRAAASLHGLQVPRFLEALRASFLAGLLTLGVQFLVYRWLADQFGNDATRSGAVVASTIVPWVVGMFPFAFVFSRLLAMPFVGGVKVYWTMGLLLMALALVLAIPIYALSVVLSGKTG